jgi:hypothetical protein
MGYDPMRPREPRDASLPVVQSLFAKPSASLRGTVPGGTSTHECAIIIAVSPHYRRLAASEGELAHLNASQRSRASVQT